MKGVGAGAGIVALWMASTKSSTATLSRSHCSLLLPLLRLVSAVGRGMSAVHGKRYLKAKEANA